MNNYIAELCLKYGTIIMEYNYQLYKVNTMIETWRY